LNTSTKCTVPVPQWVKAAVDVWSTAAGITKGTVFRSINKSGSVWGEGMTPKVLWEVVKEAASRAGIEKLAPHDLRRYAECRIMPNPSRLPHFGAHSSFVTLRIIRHNPHRRLGVRPRNRRSRQVFPGALKQSNPIMFYGQKLPSVLPG
jgi:integrase